MALGQIPGWFPLLHKNILPQPHLSSGLTTCSQIQSSSGSCFLQVCLNIVIMHESPANTQHEQQHLIKQMSQNKTSK
jgi:hypothetical protein